MEWVRGESIGCGTSSTVNLAIAKKGFDACVSRIAVKSCGSFKSSLLENEKEVLNQLGECAQIIQCFGDSHSVENGVRLYNLLLEYAAGGSLADQVKKSGGGLAESDLKSYTRSLLKGLSHIHAKGFAHCDIKLQNLLLFGDGEMKIADFGLATKTGEKQRSIEIRGTPLNIAPESVKENEYDSPCDIWALGCAVVEMVTGKPAWDCKTGTNVAALLIRIGVGDQRPTIPQEMSEEGKDFLSKCFVKDPAKRWTAEMLLNHPFAAKGDDTIALKHSEKLSSSPRCPFDFPDWVSTQSSPKSEFWSDAEVESSFDWSFSRTLISPPDRIQQLMSDQRCDWSDSGSWVTVR